MIIFHSCSGSKKNNYDYQMAWSSFKIVNINVRDDYNIQKVLSELGVKPFPEYIDIEVITGYDNDGYIRLNDSVQRYNMSQLTASSLNYLKSYKGSNKVRSN